MLWVGGFIERVVEIELPGADVQIFVKIIVSGMEGPEIQHLPIRSELDTFGVASEPSTN